VRSVTGVKKEGTPFAIGLDGAVYVSVFAFDGVTSLEDAMRVVGAEQDVFIGVRVTTAELRRVRGALGDAGSDAAAHLVGRRQRRAMR
jgi:hypothetical protein